MGTAGREKKRIQWPRLVQSKGQKMSALINLDSRSKVISVMQLLIRPESLALHNKHTLYQMAYCLVLFFTVNYFSGSMF